MIKVMVRKNEKLWFFDTDTIIDGYVEEAEEFISVHALFLPIITSGIIGSGKVGRTEIPEIKYVVDYNGIIWSTHYSLVTPILDGKTLVRLDHRDIIMIEELIKQLTEYEIPYDVVIRKK